MRELWLLLPPFCLVLAALQGAGDERFHLEAGGALGFRAAAAASSGPAPEELQAPSGRGCCRWTHANQTSLSLLLSWLQVHVASSGAPNFSCSSRVSSVGEVQPDHVCHLRGLQPVRRRGLSPPPVHTTPALGPRGAEKEQRPLQASPATLVHPRERGPAGLHPRQPSLLSTA